MIKVSKYSTYQVYCELVNYGSKDKFKENYVKTLFYITQKILLEFPYQDYINCIIQKIKGVEYIELYDSKILTTNFKTQ